MRQFITRGIACVAILVATMVGTANAFTVTETADFQGFTFGAPTVGNLSLGLNTVSGSLNSFCSDQGDPFFNCNNSPDGQDSFVFDIPSTLAVDSIGIEISEVIGPAGFFPTLSGFTVSGNPFSFSFELSGGILSSGNVLGTTAFPVVGIDSFVLSVFGRGADVAGDWSLDYTVSINAIDPAISPVPLPAALPLFVGGLSLFGLLGWRRKRKEAAYGLVNSPHNIG